MELLNKCRKKWITPKSLAALLSLVYAGSLIPMLWISWYNFPSADDYSIGSNCRQTWVLTHSLFRVIGQGIARAVEDWISWMGYFTSNFLMAVPPNTFGERWYILTAWVMAGMLSVSTAYLLHGIFVRIFKADKYVSRCVIMLVLFVSVQCMCPEGRVEAFYWYAGAANYILVHSFSLFFYGTLIAIVYDKGRKRVWDLAAAAFLGFITGGGNQMTALNVAIVLFVILAFITVQKKWAQFKGLLLPAGTFYAGFLLNVAAPGNWVRAEGAFGMNPVKAVLVSLYQGLDLVLSEWTTWPVLVIAAAMIPLFWNMAAKTAFPFSYPAIALLFGFGLVSAMMTPPIFAVGNMDAGRLRALTFLMYILVLTLCVGYVTGWVRKRTEKVYGPDEKRSPEGGERGLGTAAWGCLAGCLCFLLIGSVLTVIPEPHYYTFTSAAADLLNGNARAYGKALEERAETYRAGGKGIIEVEALPAQPVLLYFSDIKEDPEDWENRGVARFYGLEGVKLKGN